MEALALLCTLHADGPTSLRRLKRAGCASLSHLERMPASELAEVLEVAPAVARRLGREARGLTTRLDVGLDDREESPGFGTGPTASPASDTYAPPSMGHLDRRDRALLEQVIGRWKEADSKEARVVPPLVVEELNGEGATPAPPPPPPPPDRVSHPAALGSVAARSLHARWRRRHLARSHRPSRR